MILYTVELSQQHIISKFDKKGNKIGETRTVVKQVIRDLPLQTAQMYKNTDKYGTCQVFKQDAIGGNRSHEVRFGDIKSGKSKRSEPTKTKVAPKAAKSSVVNKAARTGDLAAAISGA